MTLLELSMEQDRRRVSVRRWILVAGAVLLAVGIGAAMQFRFFLNPEEVSGRYVLKTGRPAREIWVLAPDGRFFQLCDDGHKGLCAACGVWRLRRSDLGTRLDLSEVTAFSGGARLAENYVSRDGASCNISSFFGTVRIRLIQDPHALLVRTPVSESQQRKEWALIRRLTGQSPRSTPSIPAR